jgi:hypothetical protein
MKERAEAFSDAFMLEPADVGKIPVPLFGIIGVTGGAGAEANIKHRKWSNTNRHQLSWAYEGQEFIQTVALDFFKMR